MLQLAQPVFPTLPILLLTPRVGGFSRSYATFNVDQLIPEINADTLEWRDFSPTIPDDDPPF